jgi:hypothetical protein
MIRKLVKIFGLLVLGGIVGIALVFVFLLVERVRGSVSLSQYKRWLVAQGEAVSPADLIQSSGAGSNGAPVVVAASKELVKGTVLPSHYPPRMRLTRSGRAIVGFDQPKWTEEKVSYDWDQLQSELQTNRATLSRIRSALSQPILDNHLDYAGGPKMLLPQLTIAKSLTYWFGSECQLALRENRLQDCGDSLITEIQLTRFLAHDQILISELVRIALAAIARTDTWEALQSDGWTDAQLAQIQKAWEACSFLTNYTHSLQGERVFVSTTFDLCRKSNAEAASLLFWEEQLGGVLGGVEPERPAWENFLRSLPAGETSMEFLKKQFYPWVWRFAWLSQCECRYATGVQRLVEISRAAEKTRSAKTAEAEVDQVIASAQNHNFYDALRFPLGASSMATLSRAVTRAMRAETERSLVLASIALKRYSLQNTNPPASLDALVPGFLAAVPTDYMDGKPIQYLVTAPGAPVLYSVGEDGVDDHGDSSPKTPDSRAGNIWARKDCVWPEPATAAEIENEPPR